MINHPIVFAVVFMFGLLGLGAADAALTRAKAKKSDIEAMVGLAAA